MSSPVAIVTGGSRGIGEATARLLAEQGYSVCVNYVADTGAAETLCASIQDDGGNAIAVQADVSQQDDVARLFSTVDNDLGPLWLGQQRRYRICPDARPTARAVTAVDVPPMNFLMIDGAGHPGTAQEFQDAIETLYPVAYSLKSR